MRRSSALQASVAPFGEPRLFSVPAPWSEKTGRESELGAFETRSLTSVSHPSPQSTLFQCEEGSQTQL